MILDLALWFKGKQFTGKDDVSDKAAYWSEILQPLRDRSPDILVIGSRDDRSALFFLNYLPDSQLTCIDRFNGADEARFDRNLSEFAPRVRKVKGYSFASLNALRREDCQFDVIFIAARHEREAMLLDSALSWPMLRKGGILIWNSYRRNRSNKPRWRRPTSAIDGFLLAYRGEYEELLRGNERIVRKTLAAPALRGAVFQPAEPKHSVIGAFRSLLRPVQRVLLAVRRTHKPVSNEAPPSDHEIEHASNACIEAGLEDFSDNLAFVSALLRPPSERAVDDLLARGEAETKDFCEKIITHYRNGGRSTAAALTRLARRIDASTLPNKSALSQQLLESVCSDHVKQRHMRTFSNYRMGESFTANMVKHVAAARSLEREQAKQTPEWFVNSKKKGHLVAAKLGARVPVTYCAGIASASIELKDDIAIKPTIGADSVGVFLVKDRSAIFDAKAKEVFAGEAELRKRIAAQLASGKVKRDSWRIEELIRGKQTIPPIDVKFYCFYGRVAMTYEVQRLHHQKRINWYDMDGKLIRTGQYEDIEFESEGLRPEEVELAAKISSEIPTPFLRIDFMRAENGDLVFCEFTPCPENFEEFNACIDLMMGREFTSAEARLRDDLLMGKSFSRFLEIYTGGHRTIAAHQLLGLG